MAIVLDDTSLATIVILVILAMVQVGKQGGPRIVIWRLLGTRWFMRVEKQPDGTAIRKAYNWKIITTHSLPSYTVRGKTWFVGGPKETIRLFGGPQWVYNYNDARPLPLEHGGDPIDPTLIHSAFENKSIEAFNGLNKKASVAKWGMFGFAILLIVILGIISVYYSYYFGVNANCALHSRACPP
jgi:hypothetical protein